MDYAFGKVTEVVGYGWDVSLVVIHYKEDPM
jgi:hypothetical protein